MYLHYTIYLPHTFIHKELLPFGYAWQWLYVFLFHGFFFYNELKKGWHGWYMVWFSLSFLYMNKSMDLELLFVFVLLLYFFFFLKIRCEIKIYYSRRIVSSFHTRRITQRRKKICLTLFDKTRKCFSCFFNGLKRNLL